MKIGTQLVPKDPQQMPDPQVKPNSKHDKSRAERSVLVEVVFINDVTDWPAVKLSDADRMQDNPAH